MKRIKDFMVIESPLIHPIMGLMEGPIYPVGKTGYQDRPHYRMTKFSGIGQSEQRLSHFLGMEIISDKDHAVARPMTSLERMETALIIGFEI